MTASMSWPVAAEAIAVRGIQRICVWIHVIGLRIAIRVVTRAVIRFCVAIVIIRVGVIRVRIVRPLIGHVGLLINHDVSSSWSYDNQTLREHS